MESSTPTDLITVYPARRVITMEPGNPTATAVAIRGGRIIEAGTVESMRPWLDAHPYVVEDRFADKVILPGFVEPHLHPLLAMLILTCRIAAPEEWRLPEGVVPGCPDRDSYLARLRAYLAEEPAEPLLTWGYHPGWHGRVGRPELDELAPDRPVVVWERSAHGFLLNSAALEWLGLDRETAEAESHGRVDYDRGHFYETGVTPVQTRLLPHVGTPERIGAGMARTAAMVHAGGVTTCGDLATGSFLGVDLEVALLAGAYENEQTPFRTFLVPSVGHFMTLNGEDLETTVDRIKALEGTGSHRLRWLKAVKTFADGAFFSQAMHLCEPGYIDGHEGEWMTEPEELLRIARPFWEAGYDFYIHANGDRGIDAALDVLADLATAHPRAEFRYDLQHFGVSREDQVTRLARLGASVSVNGYYLHLLGDKYAEEGLGAERANQMTRVGSLVRAGVPVSLHSDLPMGPVQPLLAVSTAVTRQSASGTVRGEHQRVTLEQALRAITIDAAWALHQDHELGSIAAGKRADLTVLDEDPYDVEPAAIRDIGVHATVFEGTVFPVGV
ncbi:amidohydrolase [Nocardioides sp. YIM 152588]|uniref:amidohydrolase n=1 Tax=Nocardioides sp. YIM 152588 TaxID=3158259 RepID=UPI0032E3B40F